MKIRPLHEDDFEDYFVDYLSRNEIEFIGSNRQLLHLGGHWNICYKLDLCKR